jgi:hypothetical protein
VAGEGWSVRERHSLGHGRAARSWRVKRSGVRTQRFCCTIFLFLVACAVGCCVACACVAAAALSPSRCARCCCCCWSLCCVAAIPYFRRWCEARGMFDALRAVSWARVDWFVAAGLAGWVEPPPRRAESEARGPLVMFLSAFGFVFDCCCGGGARFAFAMAEDELVEGCRWRVACDWSAPRTGAMVS